MDIRIVIKDSQLVTVRLNEHISLDVLNELMTRQPARILRPGESWGLYREREVSVFWLKAGIVKLGCYTPEGQEDLRYLVRGETMIGEMAMLGKAHPEDFAVAVSECIVYEISMGELSQMFQKVPALRGWMMELMRHRLNILERKLQSILFQPSKDRVLLFLQSYLKEFGEISGDILRIPAYLSHTDIAQFTSTSRQTVNRVLNELRKKEVLDYNKDWLWMKERNLEMLCK